MNTVARLQRIRPRFRKVNRSTLVSVTARIPIRDVNLDLDTAELYSVNTMEEEETLRRDDVHSKKRISNFFFWGKTYTIDRIHYYPKRNKKQNKEKITNLMYRS